MVFDSLKSLAILEVGPVNRPWFTDHSVKPDATSPSDLASMVMSLRCMVQTHEATIAALRAEVQALRDKSKATTVVNHVTNNVTVK